MIGVLYVGLGGFIGASLRYLITVLFSPSVDFPIVTLFINIIGSFVIGVIFALSENTAYINDTTKLFFQTGICGGFTTFSTFSLETFNLIERGSYLVGGVYIFFSVLFCLIGVFLGKCITGMIVK